MYPTTWQVPWPCRAVASSTSAMRPVPGPGPGQRPRSWTRPVAWCCRVSWIRTYTRPALWPGTTAMPTTRSWILPSSAPSFAAASSVITRHQGSGCRCGNGTTPAAIDRQRNIPRCVRRSMRRRCSTRCTCSVMMAIMAPSIASRLPARATSKARSWASQRQRLQQILRLTRLMWGSMSTMNPTAWSMKICSPRSMGRMTMPVMSKISRMSSASRPGSRTA